ncbi:MAG: response regulator transcription factor [Salinivenus sp.]
MADQIYIVEDHGVMRQGYASLVEREMGLQIRGKTGSATDARGEIPEVDPDLAIVDLSLDEGSGLELIKDLQSQCSDLKVLVVSMHDESLYAERALEAGAEGYVSKSEPSETVVTAIRQLLDGRMYFSEDINEQMLLRYLGRDTDGPQSPLDVLSDRELEVFEHMGRGLTTQEIAEALQLSPKTIGTYRSRAKEKLAVESNAELRRRAVVWVELAEA